MDTKSGCTRAFRREAVGVGCAAMFFGVCCAPSWAQSLPVARHNVDFRSGFTLREEASGALPLNLAVDWVGQSGQQNYSMQGTAETSGGLRPLAAVQVEASSGTYQFQIDGNARIEYFARIRAIGTPPPGNYSIPTVIFVRGEAHGHARAFVRLNYGTPYVAQTINGDQTFDIGILMEIDPNDPQANLVFVELLASASGHNMQPAFASSSQAYADPLFTFDQALFDQQMGANTFPLADYFEFEYSEWLLNPPGAPVIVTHPVSQSLCQGGEVILTTAATSDAPLTYQWQLNGSALSDFGAFSGTTTPMLTINPAMGFDSGQYDCVITNVAGSVTTSAALVTVDTPALIYVQPQPVTVASGQPMAMTVYTQGSGPISYQWRRNGENLVDDGRISGATTADLVIDPTMLADAGQYDVIVSNMCGGMTSDTAELMVTGCAADFNADTAVDFFDYLDFVAAFSSGDPAADFNADWSIDFFDYLDFVAAFSSGC
jgi:hypothetical protein